MLPSVSPHTEKKSTEPIWTACVLFLPWDNILQLSRRMKELLIREAVGWMKLRRHLFIKTRFLKTISSTVTNPKREFHKGTVWSQSTVTTAACSSEIQTSGTWLFSMKIPQHSYISWVTHYFCIDMLWMRIRNISTDYSAHAFTFSEIYQEHLPVFRRASAQIWRKKSPECFTILACLFYFNLSLYCIKIQYSCDKFYFKIFLLPTIRLITICFSSNRYPSGTLFR